MKRCLKQADAEFNIKQEMAHIKTTNIASSQTVSSQTKITQNRETHKVKSKQESVNIY